MPLDTFYADAAHLHEHNTSGFRSYILAWTDFITGLCSLRRHHLNSDKPKFTVWIQVQIWSTLSRRCKLTTRLKSNRLKPFTTSELLNWTIDALRDRERLFIFDALSGEASGWSVDAAASSFGIRLHRLLQLGVSRTFTIVVGAIATSSSYCCPSLPAWDDVTLPTLCDLDLLCGGHKFLNYYSETVRASTKICWRHL